jgi:pyruvate ferredoxin oxidoreductase beta subunit/2-oxoisovalerate ferredoxin oxidoreductase beta subunit
MVQEPLLGGAATAPRRRDPILRPGGTNCGGCGMSIAFQLLDRAVDERPVQLVIPACCAIVTPGQYPRSAYGVPVVAATFASAAAVATGLARAARLNGERTRVICWAGDGGTFDIGLATLSAAAERGEDLLYVCYDNEIYGNTGGQRSSATPLGAVTTTTPRGKTDRKKDIVAILAAHRVPYAATVSLAHPEDALRKLRLALELTGFRFLHVLSPCPTGWKSEPSDGIELVRLAVRSGLYPVYTVRDGDEVEIDVEPELSLPALRRYFELQHRFRAGAIDLDEVASSVRDDWRRLRRRAKAGEEDPR